MYVKAFDTEVHRKLLKLNAAQDGMSLHILYITDLIIIN